MIDWLNKGLIDPDKLITHTFDYQHVIDAIELFEKDQRQCCKVLKIIGAFVFGKMGDRIGRKKVLFITITMMGICTTLIGVLPTYAQIGIFAPVLLVTLRIIWHHFLAGRDGHQLRYVERDGDLGGDVLCA